MSHYTPGPWEAEQNDPYEWAINAPKGEERLHYAGWHELATVYGADEANNPKMGEFIGQQNAMLIAAAPELADRLGNAISALASLRGYIERMHPRGLPDEAILYNLAALNSITKGLEILRPIWGAEPPCD